MPNSSMPTFQQRLQFKFKSLQFKYKKINKLPEPLVQNGHNGLRGRHGLRHGNQSSMRIFSYKAISISRLVQKHADNTIQILDHIIVGYNREKKKGGQIGRNSCNRSTFRRAQ